MGWTGMNKSPPLLISTISLPNPVLDIHRYSQRFPNGTWPQNRPLTKPVIRRKSLESNIVQDNQHTIPVQQSWHCISSSQPRNIFEVLFLDQL
jgi:hypothetical protein